ncbi:MAG: hypothetical protein ABIL01_31245 [Pseudomonadota bacterium]
MRQHLLVRIQPVDVVGDGRAGEVMGDRTVVLPEAADQIVAELRDRGDRLGCAGDDIWRTVRRVRAEMRVVAERLAYLAHASTNHFDWQARFGSMG